MKSNTIMLFSFLLSLAITGCKKENSCLNCVTRNRPPVAVAGPDQTISLPLNNVVLDGSASNDTDGGIITWRWNKIYGPGSYNISSPAESLTTVTQLEVGTYQFELKVTDKGNLSATDTVQITVLDFGNRPPVADAGPDQTITLPADKVTLDGTASTDPDNNIAGYSWLKISGPNSYNFSNTSLASVSVTNLVAGTYLFELTVTDAGGLKDKDTVKVQVNWITNTAPVINRGKDIKLMLPQDWVVLTNSYTDTENNVNKVSWNQISGPNTAIIAYGTAEYKVFASLAQGEYQFVLTVTDEFGLYDKDTISVSLHNVANIPQNAKEIILSDQPWYYPWYTEVEIKDFYSFIPPESLYRIYIRREGSADWIDVPGSIIHDNSDIKYDYFIERRFPDRAGQFTNSNLVITYYGIDAKDTPDIKIVYW